MQKMALYRTCLNELRRRSVLRATVEQLACCSSNSSNQDGSSSGNGPPKVTANLPPPPPAPQNPKLQKPVKIVVKSPPTVAKMPNVLKAIEEYRRGPKKADLIGAEQIFPKYCLNESDLEGLAHYERRSAYSNEDYVKMYNEKDVEVRAIKRYGSLEALDKERRRRVIIFGPLRAQLPHPSSLGRDSKKKHRSSKDGAEGAEEVSLTTGSGRVVLFAIGVNFTNVVVKSFIWLLTGSHSMFAESVHSLMDTMNQIVVAWGIHHSIKKPDKLHPYGYKNFPHVTSLISGVAFFCVGAGLSWYHGVLGLALGGQLDSPFWAFVGLAGSLLSESATLFMAYKLIRKKAAAEKLTIRQFVKRGDDPSLNVVLYEDIASVLGVSIASTSLLLSLYLQTSIPDAIGSICIGTLLAMVAGQIIYTNSVHLVGRSMPQEETERMIQILSKDRMLRSVEDVKTTELGGDETRFKAEVELNGYELTKDYLKNEDLQKLLDACRSFESTDDVEKFVLYHGEQIVDRVGAEIDRLENRLKEDNPDLRHVDLEVL